MIIFHICILEHISIFILQFSADQFKRLRDGDRFFFTHNNVLGSTITETARKYIMDRKFSDIICDHTDIKNIQPDVFRLHDILDNKLRPCVKDKNKDDLINIFKEDNFMKKGKYRVSHDGLCSWANKSLLLIFEMKFFFVNFYSIEKTNQFSYRTRANKTPAFYKNLRVSRWSCI